MIWWTRAWRTLIRTILVARSWKWNSTLYTRTTVMANKTDCKCVFSLFLSLSRNLADIKWCLYCRTEGIIVFFSLSLVWVPICPLSPAGRECYAWYKYLCGIKKYGRQRLRRTALLEKNLIVKETTLHAAALIYTLLLVVVSKDQVTTFGIQWVHWWDHFTTRESGGTDLELYPGKECIGKI